MRVVKIKRIKDRYEVNGVEFTTLAKAIETAKSKRNKEKKRVNKKSHRFRSEKLGEEFRSNWEIEMAEMLTELGITYKYEPRRFYYKHEKESYLPDFYLPKFNVYLEVKGYMDKRSLKRIKLFRKYNREYGFVLYEKEERELALKDPTILLELISIAQQEVERDDSVQ